MIAVRDVQASSRWYQEVLALDSAHGGDEYEMLTHADVLVLQLHKADRHEHPLMGEPGGSGVVLWFGEADFDAVLERIESTGIPIADGPLVNPLAHHREVWLRDPDGHVVVVSSPLGDLG